MTARTKKEVIFFVLATKTSGALPDKRHKDEASQTLRSDMATGCRPTNGVRTMMDLWPKRYTLKAMHFIGCYACKDLKRAMREGVK